jgi:16S rRNA (uracil1498-N3)-methyltransferase
MNNDNEDLRKNLFIIVHSEIFKSVLSGAAVLLDQTNIHHIRKVLRETGDIPVNISCGDGRILASELNTNNLITKLSESFYTLTRSLKVTLMTPAIKRKNLEILLKKITEIGVDMVVFIQSQYQNFKAENADRYEKLLISSCEQSKNPLIPEIQNTRFKLQDYPFDSRVFYIWGDPSSDFSLKLLLTENLSAFKEICYINGPEGGWSSDEEKFLKNRFRSVRLSQNVLRSETAAINAIFGIKLLTQNFNEK